MGNGTNINRLREALEEKSTLDVSDYLFSDLKYRSILLAGSPHT